jgi:hypothetical protein
MNGHGGTRASAGRKSKADKFAGPIADAEKRIADRLPEVIDWMFELAEGVTVQESMPNGGTRIYTRPPDRQANEYLLNRIMGKPTERHEVSGEDGEPIPVQLSTLPIDDLRELRRIFGAMAGG